LGTSLFTLVALAPQAARKKKVQLNGDGIKLGLEYFQQAVKNDSRYGLLAVIDTAKLLLSLLTLSQTP